MQKEHIENLKISVALFSSAILPVLSSILYKLNKDELRLDEDTADTVESSSSAISAHSSFKEGVLAEKLCLSSIDGILFTGGSTGLVFKTFFGIRNDIIWTVVTT